MLTHAIPLSTKPPTRSIKKDKKMKMGLKKKKKYNKNVQTKGLSIFSWYQRQFDRVAICHGIQILSLHIHSVAPSLPCCNMSWHVVLHLGSLP
jgi:hypothetical protein